MQIILRGYKELLVDYLFLISTIDHANPPRVLAVNWPRIINGINVPNARVGKIILSVRALKIFEPLDFINHFFLYRKE